MGTTAGSVTSRDGTTIAYERLGNGPTIVLVGAALADQAGTRKLAGLLAERLTVLNYDRRGRGGSGDTQPYSVRREVEDMEALIDAAGGSAYLFGSSSGAVLALDALAALGDKVDGAVLYEPPLIVDGSRPPMPAELSAEIQGLVAAGRRSEAVQLFFRRGMGIPGPFVHLMRWLMPGWAGMAKVAHTLPYDLAILAGTQSGRPLPVGRWASATGPVLVMVGSRSEPFFHTGAQALVRLVANAEYRRLEGAHHGSVVMAPAGVAAEVVAFVGRC
jgi:pimeloyl-ACP methyl ester carboxylesterase